MALEVTVYTVEARERADTPYPASDFHTQNYEAAREYAAKNRLLLIENTYEWADSNLLEDYAPKDWAIVDEEGDVQDRYPDEEEATEGLPHFPEGYAVRNIPDEGEG